MPPTKYTPFKILGLEVPLPKWGVYLVTSIAVLAFGAFVANYIEDNFNFHDKGNVELSESEFIQIRESQKHITENPEAQIPIISDVRGELKAYFYKSDNCLLISRKSSDSSLPPVNSWLLDPIRADVSRPPSNTSEFIPDGGLFSSPAFAQNCRGNCLNPHPGEFRWWNGERNGCWLKVWRQWEEGCTHYQWFNTCSNYWDVHPDGSAKVFWTCCVH